VSKRCCSRSPSGSPIWKNPTHVLIFVTSVLGYTIVALGLVALGAHVSRACNRVVAVLETMAPR